MNNLQKSTWFYALFALVAMIELASALLMQPIFDDLTYLTAPYERNVGETFLPYTSWWRPIDALIGWFLEGHRTWFPALNHVLVWLFHVLSAITVYALMLRFHIQRSAARVGVMFFLLAPSMLATLLDTDSINQAGALFFGLWGLNEYISQRRKGRVALWLALTLIATLFKENGITWFVITPLMAYAWTEDGRKRTLSMLAAGLACACAYLAVRFVLPHTGEANGEYQSYFANNIIKTLGKIVTTAILPMDNVSLIHDERHWLAVLFLLLTLPFLALITYKGRSMLPTRRTLITVVCLLIALLPHIITMYAVMHAYNAQPFTTLLLALLLQQSGRQKAIGWLLVPFFAGLIGIDAHHCIEKYKSGKYMEQLGTEAMTIIKSQPLFRTETPDSIYSICIESDYRKYNTFCLRDAEAFSWGNAVRFANHYEWPETWKDTVISCHDVKRDTIDSLATRAYKDGYRLVLKIENGHARLINTENIIEKK